MSYATSFLWNSEIHVYLHSYNTIFLINLQLVSKSYTEVLNYAGIHIILCDMLPRDTVILKTLDAEMGPAKVLETEWTDLVLLAMGPHAAGCQSAWAVTLELPVLAAKTIIIKHSESFKGLLHGAILSVLAAWETSSLVKQRWPTSGLRQRPGVAYAV